MKKWEKPRVKKLSLNYTQEDGIDPLAFWNSVKYCSKCCAKYIPHKMLDLGYYYEGDRNVHSYWFLDGWHCNIKGNNGLPCGGNLKNLENTLCS